ncbi:sirohydrochlorin chelatase [Fodinicola acaciae]|uniref:sirohydrochlorin chelatase n=1 Tax=Fodinicola acaciae TaxID=2681555 RepID=UPI0013D53CA8|nr:sirohydrochlorin chelatase [Fodinicola acaciae]
MSPTLVAVAHGSRDPRAARSTYALVEAVRKARPEVTVRTAFLELTEPLLSEVLAELDEPAVVVPLLLSGGYHVHVDIPGVAGGHQVAPALGPSALLVEALSDRLREAGWREGPVVLAAAGSTDQRAVDDSLTVGRMLSDALETDVTTSFVSAASPTVEEACAGRRVAVATYLLAPGFFADRVAEAAGPAVCSAPLGDHPAVAGLVWQRYDASRS